MVLVEGVHGDLQSLRILRSYPIHALYELIGISRAEPLAS